MIDVTDPAQPETAPAAATPRRGVISTARQVMAIISDRHVGLNAAAVAFYAMFSLFPALAALIAVFGLLADPAVVAAQLELMADFVPDAAYILISEQIAALLAARSETLGWASILSLLIALWAARAGVGALIQALNAVFEAPNRGGIAHTLVALALTLSLIGLSIAALLAVVVMPIVLAFVPLGPLAALALEAGRWIVALGVLILALGLLYRFGPNRSGQRLRWITPGAVAAIVLWLAASLSFSIYLTNFGNYNEVYGSIGAVAALLMWFYISAYLVLLGAVLNAVLERPQQSSGKDVPELLR